MYMVEIWVGAMQILYKNSQYFGNLITLYGNNGQSLPVSEDVQNQILNTFSL
jgi:hypothetical protein